jgi:hypothetical protein
VAPTEIGVSYALFRPTCQEWLGYGDAKLSAAGIPLRFAADLDVVALAGVRVIKDVNEAACAGIDKTLARGCHRPLLRSMLGR